ncbi:CHAD domain-containing protein [Saccharopolyspora rhizosphaerae]|uniref:CHAD domain-containing protein n=1 Tax=Saccharopolyspora rhizosphaerae TaxID=2492662 RepID=A0A3R8NYC4_9PSEU|nr:CHAD domain-containing protein [Saccharopolyspora rhizosphaerae]RRO15565.1 CHAD domain-containing protein [Saccharopolyspora rhizosphaerae]
MAASRLLEDVLASEPVEVDREATITAHVRAALDARLRALLAHEAGARRGDDPEDLHQMRVPVRRMRAMLRSARPFLDREESEPLRAELGWLGRALGPVRDLDVLRERLRSECAGLPDAERSAAEQLISGLDAEHRKARAEMLAALDSERYRKLLERLAWATRELPGVDSDVDAEPLLRGLVRRQIAKLRRAVERLPAEPTDDELHSLRIDGKKVRYTAELAEPLLGAPVTRLIKAAKGFQDVLGEHQDACFAAERLRALLDGFGPRPEAGTAFAAGRLVEREEVRKAHRRAQWPAAWETLTTAASAV